MELSYYKHELLVLQNVMPASGIGSEVMKPENLFDQIISYLAVRFSTALILVRCFDKSGARHGMKCVFIDGKFVKLEAVRVKHLNSHRIW